MKIVFTGGSSGGHFYPIIAVAEAIKGVAREGKYLDPKLYYFGPTEYNEQMLFNNDITFKRIVAGKQRKGYGGFANFLDLFKIAQGTLQAVWHMYRIFPDVVFSKGSYAAFPTLLAARFFGIPVVIHESDSRPGKVNRWAGKFAQRIAVSYEDAVEHFEHKDRVAFTGNPIRKGLGEPVYEGADTFFGLREDLPTLLVLGGSQGAQAINEAIISALPDLVEKMQVIHQTGAAHEGEVSKTARIVLEHSQYKDRYKPYGYLNTEAMRYAAGAADLVITRAGSALFEIALWKVPAIVVPIPEPLSHDQRSNAYAYARTGAGEVVEEENLTANILLSQVESVLSDPERNAQMREDARRFARRGAAEKIARAVFDIGTKHEG